MKKYQPIDHGWAWVICFATGVQAFFVIGGLKSMGVLFMTIVEKFEAPPSLAALTLGLVAAGFAVFVTSVFVTLLDASEAFDRLNPWILFDKLVKRALLSTAFAVKFGHRQVTLFGCVLLIFSSFMTIWAMNIYFVIVFMGLLSGLAFGAMATPAVVLLNYYFDQKKSLANGLAMVGSSIGQLSLPYVMTYLVDEYGFRGAMLLYTGICLQSIPAAMLLWPTTFWIPKYKNGTSEVETMQDLGKDTILTDDDVKNITKNSSLAALNVSHTSLNSHESKSDHKTSLIGSKLSLKPYKHSTIHGSTGSIMLGMSIENIAQTLNDANEQSKTDLAKNTHFCKVLFDPDLIRSLTMWMLFLAIGVGHAGFIDACLYIPSLAYDLFDSKYTGAQLIMVIGFFDIAGRIGGGLFADTGILKRTTITSIALTTTGIATLLSMSYPVFEVLVAYSITMGLVGGVYRILLPVIIQDLFGPSKVSSGVGLGFLSMGVFILPMPTILGKMKESYGSYIPALMLCGAALVFGGILMTCMPLFKKFDEKHNPMFKVNTDYGDATIKDLADGHQDEEEGLQTQTLSLPSENKHRDSDLVVSVPTDMTEADIADVKV